MTSLASSSAERTDNSKPVEYTGSMNPSASPISAQPFGSTGEKCSALKSTRSVGDSSQDNPRAAEQATLAVRCESQKSVAAAGCAAVHSPHGDKASGALAETSSVAVAGCASWALSTATAW